MKRTLTGEVDFCGKCQRRADFIEKGDRCGIERCRDCRQSSMVRYDQRVHGGGTGDVQYCTSCDMELCETKSDPIHQAFFAVRELRQEEERWYASFKKRAEAAEARVAKLIAR